MRHRLNSCKLATFVDCALTEVYRITTGVVVCAVNAFAVQDIKDFLWRTDAVSVYEPFKSTKPVYRVFPYLLRRGLAKTHLNWTIMFDKTVSVITISNNGITQMRIYSRPQIKNKYSACFRTLLWDASYHWYISSCANIRYIQSCVNTASLNKTLNILLAFSKLLFLNENHILLQFHWWLFSRIDHKGALDNLKVVWVLIHQNFKVWMMGSPAVYMTIV